MRELWAALLLAYVAYSFARALGIPAWTGWAIGDATDIATATFAAVWFLAHPSPTKSNEGE